jgi:glycosyltransferase involved in cell wall biosynthesis
MTILTLSNCPLDPALGSGKARLRWVEGLRRNGFVVQPIEPAALTAKMPRLGVRFRLALGALRKVDLRGVDLLECYGAEFGWACRRIFRQNGRPLIVAHTDGMELHQTHCMAHAPEGRNSRGGLKRAIIGPLHEWLARSAFANVDRMVTGSPGDVAYARSLGMFLGDTATSVGLGIDDEFLGLEFNPVRSHEVAFLGTWSGRKATERMTRVMTRVLQDDPAVRFNILGASGSQPLVHRAFSPELHARITIQPKLPVGVIIAQLQRAKVKILLSHYEGFGMATMEAMACGCAVVVTPTGFGSALQDNVDAVVRSFDDEDGMRRAILDLLKYDDRRVRLARAGWGRVQNMRWDRQTDRLADVYRGWLERWDPASATLRKPGPLEPTTAP